jgi:asparagine synthase (glutamine-hydrolysing)
MSGIAGIYHFEGAQPDPEQLLVLGDALNERGPDGGNEILDGSVGMVYRAFHTNAESRRERQPLVSRFGHILCWDGRLDNRDDLLCVLDSELRGDRTDAGLVLAAYEKWGAEFLARIIGDFALSLWDPLHQTLILARDPFGVRPLYYFRNNEELIWSSTQTSLLALRAIDAEVNEEYVAGCFALYPELSSTPYRGITAFEPGQVVTVRGRRFQTRRFWRPAQNDEIHYANDHEYEEHFRQLFREAVSCRLRSDRPVWSELSGGLDSSSIVFMADRIQAETSGTPVKTLSFVDSSSTTFFDHRFIEVVESARGVQGLHVDGGGQWIQLAAPDDNSIVTPLTSLCVADLHRRVWRSMRDEGARVLLSGLGGDQVTWSNLEPGPELCDLFVARKPMSLHRRLQVWSEATHIPYAQLLWQEVALPFLPLSFRARFQNQIQISSWLNPAFVKRMKIHERLVLPKDPFAFTLPSRRIQSSRIWYIVMNIARGEYWEHAAYEKTYPFLHRPLVEFLMNVPIGQKLRPDETRSLMRRALPDLLPKRILERRNKGTTGEALCRGLASEWPRIRPLLEDARLARQGYVDGKELIQAFDRARHGMEFNISCLLQALALEVWLRSLEYRRSVFGPRSDVIASGATQAWANRTARAVGVS